MAIHNVSDKTIAELISLEGRSVVITGAGAGIGRSVALRFAEAGAKVMATDVNIDAATETVARLSGSGHLAASLDVTDGAAVAAIAAEAVAKF
ncbi:hypothetical protein JP75_18380, partial [Devosia riboflavina]